MQAKYYPSIGQRIDRNIGFGNNMLYYPLALSLKLEIKCVRLLHSFKKYSFHDFFRTCLIWKIYCILDLHATLYCPEVPISPFRPKFRF